MHEEVTPDCLLDSFLNNEIIDWLNAAIGRSETIQHPRFMFSIVGREFLFISADELDIKRFIKVHDWIFYHTKCRSVTVWMHISVPGRTMAKVYGSTLGE